MPRYLQYQRYNPFTGGIIPHFPACTQSHAPAGLLPVSFARNLLITPVEEGHRPHNASPVNDSTFFISPFENVVLYSGGAGLLNSERGVQECDGAKSPQAATEAYRIDKPPDHEKPTV